MQLSHAIALKPWSSGLAVAQLLAGEDAGLAIEAQLAGVVQAVVKGHTTNYSGDANGLLTNTSPSTKYVRDHTGLYVPGTTLRTDHDASGNALGLLIEEQRTNLLTYSEQFDNAAWSKFSDAEVVADQVISPDGNQSADLLRKASDITSSSFIRQSVSNQTGIAQLLAFVKAGVGWNSTYLSFTAGSSGGAYFNMDTGQFSSIDGNLTDTSAVEVGDGWWMITIERDVTGITLAPGIYVANNGSTAGTGDGEGIYIWGAQLEAGSEASSYIKTENSQITLNVDDITIPQADFPWNGGSGTLTINGSTYTPETDGTDFDIAQTCIVNSIDHLKTLTWVPQL